MDVTTRKRLREEGYRAGYGGYPLDPPNALSLKQAPDSPFAYIWKDQDNEWTIGWMKGRKVRDRLKGGK